MTEENDEQELLSKSEIKRQCDELQKVGEALIQLKNDDLEGMDLPEILLSAVLEARRIKSRAGLKRQRQYIGKIMREIESDSVIEQLDHIRHRHDVSNASFKKTELWRDRLLDDNRNELTELLNQYPDMDRQHLNQLLRQARKEHSEDRPPAAARKLFRYLRGFIESE